MVRGASILAIRFFTAFCTFSKALTSICRTRFAGVLTAVRTVTESGQVRVLRLSTPARKLLDQAKARFARLAVSQAYPLTGYYRAGADLALRVAGVLLFIDTALSGADKLATEIGQDSVSRAIAFV